MMTDAERKRAINFIITQGGRVPRPEVKTEVKTETVTKKARSGIFDESLASGVAKANERAKAQLLEMHGGKLPNRTDGFPWNPGFYTCNFEGRGISEAQTKFDAFLKAMAKRPSFQLLHQNFTEFYNGVSIFVTYRI